jgi:uncharacterized membrane protein
MAGFAAAVSVSASPHSARTASPPLVLRARCTNADLAALTLGLTFALLLSGLALARHAAFASGQHDLEIYLQALWNTADGRPFATTLLKSNELHLAEHLALPLLALAPLYALVSAAELILPLQQIALALAGVPIWLHARRRLGSRVGLLVLAAFYLTPTLATIALDDFHPVTFTAAPLAAAGWLLAERRWRPALMLALLSALLEEEASLVLIGLGGWLLLAHQRGPGARLLGAGLALLLTATLLIMPGFHHPVTLIAAGENRAMNHFAELRADPEVVWRRVGGGRGLDAFNALLLPVGATALLAPVQLTAVLPTAVALFLQDRGDTFQRHWAAPVLPLIWLASLAGLARQLGGRRRAGLVALTLGSSTAYLLASPLPGGGAFDPTSLTGGPHAADLHHAVAAVPPDAVLAASANVAAHLANRSEVYVYPIDDHYLSGLHYEDRPLDGYVLDLQEANTQRLNPLRRTSPLLADPPYVVWSSGHKVTLLTRAMPTPGVPLSATFNQRMALLGYDLERNGHSASLTLYWQKIRGVFADYERVADLMDADGTLLLRDTDLPFTRLFTTEKWRIGQIVVDRLDLTPPASGATRLRLAWQNRDRATPMPLDGGGQALELRLNL